MKEHLFSSTLASLISQALPTERTQALIAAAGEIKQTGATGAYSHEFESMEEKISDVRDILLSANMTSQSLASLEELIKELRLSI